MKANRSNISQDCDPEVVEKIQNNDFIDTNFKLPRALAYHIQATENITNRTTCDCPHCNHGGHILKYLCRTAVRQRNWF